MTTCTECGKEFAGRGKNSKYCGRNCSRARYQNDYIKSNSKLNIPAATVGAMHELLVCADLLRKGFAVFRSVSSACSCDLAVLQEKTLLRIEVTTGRTMPSGKLIYPKKNPEKFDVLAIVLHDQTIIYFPEMKGVAS